MPSYSTDNGFTGNWNTGSTGTTGYNGTGSSYSGTSSNGGGSTSAAKSSTTMAAGAKQGTSSSVNAAAAAAAAMAMASAASRAQQQQQQQSQMQSRSPLQGFSQAQFGNQRMSPGQIYSNPNTSGAALRSVVNGINLQGGTSPQKVDAMLRNMGYNNPNGRAGMVGTFGHESVGFSPKVLNGQIQGDAGTAFGLGQWRFDRQDAAKSFLNQNQLPQNSLLGQTAFGGTELANKYTSAYRGVQNAKSPEEGVAAMNGYERPRGWKSGGDPTRVAGWKDRVNQARSALNNQPSYGTPQQASKSSPLNTAQNPNAPLGSGLGAGWWDQYNATTPNAGQEGVLASRVTPQGTLENYYKPVATSAEPQQQGWREWASNLAQQGNGYLQSGIQQAKAASEQINALPGSTPSQKASLIKNATGGAGLIGQALAPLEYAGNAANEWVGNNLSAPKGVQTAAADLGHAIGGWLPKGNSTGGLLGFAPSTGLQVYPGSTGSPLSGAGGGGIGGSSGGSKSGERQGNYWPGSPYSNGTGHEDEDEEEKKKKKKPPVTPTTGGPRYPTYYSTWANLPTGLLFT